MDDDYMTQRPGPWTGSSAASVAECARRWLATSALADLAACLGGPELDGSVGSLHAFREWTAATLDTRGGAERREARPLALPERRQRLVIEAAGPLGLLSTADPTRDSYDAIVILGAATTGNKLRAELARAVTCRLNVPLVVAATADRPLTASEYASDPESVADGTEWRHLRRCLSREFGTLIPANPAPRCPGAGQDLAFTGAAGEHIRLTVAPSAGASRPTTRSQLRYVRERIPVHMRDTTLLVTNSIYAPYQFFAGAPELLTDGASHVELIGTPTNAGSDTGLLAQRLLQEIHAALDTALSLLHPEHR
jgi:hypothetical protein